MSIVDMDMWQQGVMFSAPSVCVLWNMLSRSDTGEPIVTPKTRKPRSGEKFVIISQDCDIQAHINAEPFIEALLCTKEANLNFLHKIDRNSARRFVIDFDIGLVAEAKYRVPLAKEIFTILTPEPWPGTSERFERFVRWLARRYDRPAIPDILVDMFQVPLERVLSRIDTEYPSIGRAFSTAVHELRVTLPASEQPPFDLQLVLMIKHDELSAEEADAIDIITDTIKGNLDPTNIHLHPDILIRTDEEISLAEHRASRPLFLEYHTYRGDEIEGASPYNRA